MLAEALKKAMRQKPFSKITVSEIISDCEINRKTFYYHFADIYALLKWMFEEDAIEIVKHFDWLSDYEQAIRFVMDYVEQNNYLLSCAYHSISREEMKRFFYTDFVGIVQTVIGAAEEKYDTKLDADFKNYFARFYTEALAGMLINWVVDKEKDDKEKTIEYLCTIIQMALSNIKMYTEKGSLGE